MSRLIITFYPDEEDPSQTGYIETPWQTTKDFYIYNLKFTYPCSIVVETKNPFTSVVQTASEYIIN